MNARSDPSELNFHEKLDTPDDCVTEYEKEEFIQALKEQVSYYSLQAFFAMPTDDGSMKNIILNSHIFELYDIIKEYESRLINPNPVIKYNNCETKESIQAQFRAYLAYKIFDRALSRLVIEYLVSPSFCEVIKTRLFYYENFDDFTSQVYFMMVLYAFKNSSEIDIEGAKKAFTNLYLNELPSENI